MNYKVLTFLVAAVGSVTGLTFATFVWTVQTWAPPEQPVLYLGIAMLLLFALSGAIWFQMTKQELASGESEEGVSAQTVGLKRLVMMVSVVLIGALGLGAAGLWLSPEFRAKLLPYAASERVQLERALEDPSDDVRQAACLQLISYGVSGSENPLAAALDSYPETAIACFETAEAKGLNDQRRIARRVASGWESRLAGSASEDAASACQVTDYLTRAREMGGLHPTAGLLACALMAESVEVRTCCAQSLQNIEGATLAEKIGPALEMPSEEGEMLFPEFVDHTFRPLSLPVEQQEVASLMKTDEEANRRWAVEFGCSLVADPDYRRTVVEGMLPVIEGGTCKLDEAAQFAFLDATQWVYLCDDILIESEIPTEQAICNAFTASLMERAVGEAQSRVKTAYRARFLTAAADELDRPYSRGGGGGGGSQKLKRHDRVYDVVGYGKTTIGSAPPPGAMCNKIVVKRNPGWVPGMKGVKPYTEHKTLAPCSTMGEPDAGMTPREAFKQKMMRAAAAARGDFKNAMTKEQRKAAEAKAGKKAFGKGIEKTSDEYKAGLKEAR